MVAITSCPPRKALPPRRLRSASPAGRASPSAAARRRAVLVLATLAALGVLLGAGSLAGAGQDPSARPRAGLGAGARPIAATIHVVQPGDTLWTLARLAQPDGDVRPLVARLRAEHGSGPLVPGERLRLAV